MYSLNAPTFTARMIYEEGETSTGLLFALQMLNLASKLGFCFFSPWRLSPSPMTAEFPDLVRCEGPKGL